jgi:phosphate-selective porin OprO and OprP
VLLAVAVVPSAVVAQPQSPLVPSVLPAGFASEPGEPIPTVPVPGAISGPPAALPPNGARPMGARAAPPVGTQPMGAGPMMGMDSGAPAAATSAANSSATDRLKMTARWNAPNPGVWIESADKNFVFHPGATVHYDVGLYSVTRALELRPGGTGKFNDGANLRRARIFFEGTLYQAVDYKFELEFANGIGFSPAGTQNEVVAGSVTNSPGPTDAWIQIKDVPWLGNIRIGSQKEWFSLEHLNNYRALEFIERSYLFDFSQPTAFNNGFSPGISVFRTWLEDRIFTAAGIYKNDSDLIGFGTGDGQYAFTGRVTALPIWMPDEQIFWHVGGAYSHRDPVAGSVQVRIRDNIRAAPFPLLNLILNTGLISAGSQDLFNIETAAVYGPLTFQAEYTANVINQASVGTRPVGGNGDLYFGACYVEGLVLLTGESRTWNAKTAYFNRVIPKHPLRLKPTDCDGYGFGAWELGVRYTYVDLSNKTVQTGRLDSITFGLNWYLNTAAKLQFNYDITQRSATPNLAQGTIHGFGTRCAFDF